MACTLNRATTRVLKGGLKKILQNVEEFELRLKRTNSHENKILETRTSRHLAADHTLTTYCFRECGQQPDDGIGDGDEGVERGCFLGRLGIFKIFRIDDV